MRGVFPNDLIYVDSMYYLHYQPKICLLPLFSLIGPLSLLIALWSTLLRLNLLLLQDECQCCQWTSIQESCIIQEWLHVGHFESRWACWSSQGYGQKL